MAPPKPPPKPRPVDPRAGQRSRWEVLALGALRVLTVNVPVFLLATVAVAALHYARRHGHLWLLIPFGIAEIALLVAVTVALRKIWKRLTTYPGWDIIDRLEQGVAHEFKVLEIVFCLLVLVLGQLFMHYDELGPLSHFSETATRMLGL